MAFYMPVPFTSGNFCDAVSLADAPLVQDFPQDAPSTYFDYTAFLDYDSYIQNALDQHQFCVDTYQNGGRARVDVYQPPPSAYPCGHHYSMATSTSMPQIDPRSSSTSVYLDPLEAWFASQVDEACSAAAPMDALSSPPSTGASHNHRVARVCNAAPVKVTQPSKRKAYDSDYEEDSGASSDTSDYVPHRPAKRPATARSVTYSPLPESLQPIRVQSATLPRCPMPGCGVELDAKDSAWRGHFKRAHHDALCLTPNCRGLVTATCKARCPLPIPGCKSCGSAEERKHGHHSRKGRESAMTIESVGRHLLNVHIKVAYRCPLCGLQNEWRESACARHIRRCAEKYEKKSNGRSLC